MSEENKDLDVGNLVSHRLVKIVQEGEDTAAMNAISIMYQLGLIKVTNNG